MVTKMKKILIIIVFIPLFSIGQSFAQEQIGSIEFEGNERFSDEKLRSIIQSKPSQDFDEYKIFKKDRERVLNFYRKEGYLNVEVGIDIVSVNDIIFQISEGNQVFLRTLKINGNEVISIDKLLGMVKIKNGEPLNLGKVAETEYEIVEYYSSKGYIYIEIDREVVRKNGKANVILHINEGPLVYVGEIECRGLNKVTENVVLRELYLEENEIFTPEKLNKSRQSVYATGLFRSVQFETKGVEAGKDTIDVILNLKEDKLKWVGFGLGYGSVDGARFSAEWGYKNLWRKAHRLSIKTLFTYNLKKNVQREVDKSYSHRYEINYFIPWLFDTRYTTELSIFHQRTIYAKHEEEKNNGSLQIGRKLTNNLEISTQARYEVTNLFRVSDDASQELKKDAGKEYINSLSLSLRFDTRNAFFKPTKGTKIIVVNEYAGGILQGSVDFNKSEGEIVSFITPISLITLGTRAKGGYAFPFKNTEVVPRTKRFFIGGPSTVRGYPTNHVGITTVNEDGEEEPVGGRVLALFNIEAMTASWKNMYLGIFGDGGYVWADKGDVDFRDLEFGFGSGIRYSTPVGPIRLDFAFPAKENTQWRDVFIHIALGSAF